MKLIPLPAFSDNYLWLIQNQGSALVVDPGESGPVTQWLNENQCELDCILVTHHHGDHTGGVAELQKKWGAKVYGPASEKLPFQCQGLREGDTVDWADLRFQVLDVPGHTAGHIAYWSKPPSEEPILFCGDTLFSGGCGRIFEGTPAQMLTAMDKLAKLPGQTRVCAAHEYTLSNLKFALAVEPHNQDLIDYSAHCQHLRSLNLPTLPAQLANELKINPFLRSRQSNVMQAVKNFSPNTLDQDVEIFANLRAWKNEFK
jgi:hydroxyacylglutathione hydrolase